MSVQEDVLLLSLRPRFADAILDGRKTAELRRTVPNAAAGAKVVLYASGPSMAVVGVATVRCVEVGTPDTVWGLAKEHAAIDRSEYAAYFDGAQRAVVIWLTDVVRLANPVSLSQVRSLGPFQPPQSFRYLRNGELDRFDSLLSSADSRVTLRPSQALAQLQLDAVSSAEDGLPVIGGRVGSRLPVLAKARALRRRRKAS